MSQMTDDVRERLNLLTEYQELAPEYITLLEAEHEAMEARMLTETRLREIVEKIGKDPAGVLPKRRRTKQEMEAANGTTPKRSRRKPAGEDAVADEDLAVA